MTRFATWNINSVRMRAHLVLDWLERNPECEVLALQEIKCQDDQFPDIFEKNGYHVLVHGQKAYNGVALVSRKPLTLNRTGLEHWEYEEARYIEATLSLNDENEKDENKNIVVTSIYLPNGNSGGEAGLEKKRRFLDALYDRARALTDNKTPFVLMGDFNICPTDEDLAPKILSDDDALIRPEIRVAWRRLLWLGLTDGLRALYPDKRVYTFWDYQSAAFQRNAGLRIDHFLLSPWLAERLVEIEIDRNERTKEKPSDHTVVSAAFSF